MGEMIASFLTYIGAATVIIAAIMAAVAFTTRWSEVSRLGDAVNAWGGTHDRLLDRYENTRRTVEDLQTRLRKIESTRQYTPPANVDK